MFIDAATTLILPSELSEMLNISLNSEGVKPEALFSYKHFVPTALFLQAPEAVCE